MNNENLYSTTDVSFAPFTSDIKIAPFRDEEQVMPLVKSPRPSLFLSGVSNLILAVAAVTSPQVHISEPLALRRSVSSSVRWSLPGRGRKISLKRARELALQILAETERNLQKERQAEVDLILGDWVNSEHLEV